MITMDAKQVGRVARGIRAASTEAWKSLRLQLRAIGQDVANDAKGRAYDPGNRIVPNIGTRTTAAGNVRIYVKDTPGVQIENKGRGFVRHPVFGNREAWTDKNSRPAFLLPAFAAKQEWALQEMEKAYLDTFERVWGEGT